MNNQQRNILLTKIQDIVTQVKETAYLIKDLEANSEQFVIEYEDILNKFSVIDYNKLPDLV